MPSIMTRRAPFFYETKYEQDTDEGKQGQDNKEHSTRVYVCRQEAFLWGERVLLLIKRITCTYIYKTSTYIYKLDKKWVE